MAKAMGIDFCQEGCFGPWDLNALLSQTLVHCWLPEATCENCLHRAEASSFLSPVSLSSVCHSFMVCVSPASSPFLLYLLWFRLTLPISRTTWMPSESHLLLLSSPLLNYEALSVLGNQHCALGSSHHVTGIDTQDDTYWLSSYLSDLSFILGQSHLPKTEILYGDRT